MSSSPGGLLPPLDPNPQGQSATSRILLTSVLMALSILMMQWLAPPQPPASSEPKAVATTETAAGADAGSGAAGLQAAPASVGTPDDLPEQTWRTSADVAKASGSKDIEGGYAATLSSWGAQIQSWQLDAYLETEPHKAPDRERGVRVDIARGAHDGARMPALRSRGGDVALAARAPWEIVERGERKVVFSRLTSSGVRLTRTYEFDPRSFTVKHELNLKNESAQKRTAELDVAFVGVERPGERDEGGLLSPATDQLGGACVVGEDRHAFFSKAVESDPADHVWKGAVRSASVDRHYFVGALTFDDVPTEGCKATAWKEGDERRGLEVVVSLSSIPLAPGETKTLVQQGFLGPKQFGVLQQFGHGLEEAVDFGMLAALSRPLLWLLIQFKAQTGDYGLAIVLLTLTIFGLTLPLTHKSMVEMKKFSNIMKTLKPELDQIKEKYGHDQRQFVEKQQQFFAERGVNPFANLMGCLPMFISMPVWMALYRTLSTSVELYQQPASWLPGVFDLTQPDIMILGWPLLPFIVCGLMLVSTLQQPPPEDQPQMKYVMYGMPVFFLFIMFSMASGLSIYMITNSLLRMAQSWWIKRKYG
ncbi:MAG: membrane protein insertase YidC [Deltaproteobacteria bacterium]|nr:membrane protein insertase YidC [Deltaproteobacteria bacterium]